MTDRDRIEPPLEPAKSGLLLERLSRPWPDAGHTAEDGGAGRARKTPGRSAKIVGHPEKW